MFVKAKIGTLLFLSDENAYIKRPTKSSKYFVFDSNGSWKSIKDLKIKTNKKCIKNQRQEVNERLNFNFTKISLIIPASAPPDCQPIDQFCEALKVK